MGDDREFCHVMMAADEPHRPLELLARSFGATEHAVLLGAGGHLRISVRAAKAQEVETPDMKPGIGQLIPPRAAIEAMGNRQRRREGAAMNVKHDLRCTRLLRGRRQIAQKQAQPFQMARDMEKFFPRVELRRRQRHETYQASWRKLTKQ